jgi:hypothetical protein
VKEEEKEQEVEIDRQTERKGNSDRKLKKTRMGISGLY